MNKAKSPTLIILLGTLSTQEKIVKEQLTDALDKLEINYVWHECKNGNSLPKGDLALFLGNCPLPLLNEARTRRMVPIVNGKSALRKAVDDFVPQDESGDGFIYNEEDIWHIFATIVKATENYKFPYDWKNIVAAGQKKVK